MPAVLIIESNFQGIEHPLNRASRHDRVVGSAGGRAGNRLVDRTGIHPELHPIAPRNHMTRGFDLRWGCQRRLLIPNDNFGERMVPRTGIEPVTRGFSIRCSTN